MTGPYPTTSTEPTDIQLMKTCGRCRLSKPLSDFHRHGKRGTQGYCKPCITVIHREWRDNNREHETAYNKAWKRRNADHILATDRLRDYGLSAECFDALWTNQRGACAICATPLTIRSANVDHDHTTKRVRGLLCRECNLGLSNFKDSPALLGNAAEYLRGGDPPLALDCTA